MAHGRGTILQETRELWRSIGIPGKEQFCMHLSTLVPDVDIATTFFLDNFRLISSTTHSQKMACPMTSMQDQWQVEVTELKAPTTVT